MKAQSQRQQHPQAIPWAEAFLAGTCPSCQFPPISSAPHDMRIFPLKARYRGCRLVWSASFQFLAKDFGKIIKIKAICKPHFLKNSVNSPMTCASERFRSATTPSTWWNTAKWVASNVSFLNTRSMLNILAGLKSLKRNISKILKFSMSYTLCQQVKLTGWDGGGVRPEHILLRFFQFPIVLIAEEWDFMLFVNPHALTQWKHSHPRNEPSSHVPDNPQEILSILLALKQ